MYISPLKIITVEIKDFLTCYGKQYISSVPEPNVLLISHYMLMKYLPQCLVFSVQMTMIICQHEYIIH